MSNSIEKSNWNIRVKQFDEQKALTELKQCPKIVRDYVKLIKGHWDNQKDLTGKAIGNLKKHAIDNLSKDQQIKELELMVAISDKTVPVGYDRGFLTTEQYNTYNTLKNNYQQKYPKP